MSGTNYERKIFPLAITSIMEIYQGAFHLPAFLTIEEQLALMQRCIEIGERPAGLYTPIVRGGASMSIKMVCLGRHWNAKTYKYEAIRTDYDGLPVQELPVSFKDLARRVATAANMVIDPDIGIINFYPPTGRLGLHQDKDESRENIEAGIPVVSISLGDSAKFLIGGRTRKDPLRRLVLESGDAIALGGASRLRYHGVSGILEGTAPREMHFVGRINLTFRQY
jgi:DNA alkylation damage repair protein AlkB